MEESEYIGFKDTNRDKEEIFLDTSKIFQELIDEVMEEEKRFLETISFPLDSYGSTC